MSLFKTGPSASEDGSLGARARGLAAQAVPQARRAGTTAVQGVMQGVDGARGWAAPRMHSAADAFSESLAPRVSSALHSAAKTVDTAPPPKSGIRRLLDWRVLLGIGAAVAAAGAAAVSMRRYQAATADAKDGADSLADESADARQSAGAHRNSESAPAAADKLKAAADKISAAADKVREAAHR